MAVVVATVAPLLPPGSLEGRRWSRFGLFGEECCKEGGPPLRLGLSVGEPGYESVVFDLTGEYTADVVLLS